MTDDTDIGGARGDFPTTAHSIIAGIAGDDAGRRERAFAAIVAAYWKPAYVHARLKWHRSNEDAKDLVQGFFARALEKRFFADYDPARARFRTFLRLCLDRYIANGDKAARALKRGGDAAVVPLDLDGIELAGADPEEVFDREWARALFERGVESLGAACRAAGKDVAFELFRRADLCEPGERPSYADLARDLELSVSDVTNRLAWARRELRRIVLEELRAITATDEEFRSEARELLGVDPP